MCLFSPLCLPSLPTSAGVGTKFVGNIGADTKPTLVLELDEEDCSFEHNKLKVSPETEQAMYLVVFRQ